MKRQREQAKREKQQMKLERRAQRAAEPQTEEPEPVVAETPIESEAQDSVEEK